MRNNSRHFIVVVSRRKIPVPDNARLKYQAEIDAIVKTLRKDKEYVVMVDEYVVSAIFY